MSLSPNFKGESEFKKLIDVAIDKFIIYDILCEDELAHELRISISDAREIIDELNRRGIIKHTKFSKSFWHLSPAFIKKNFIRKRMLIKDTIGKDYLTGDRYLVNHNIEKEILKMIENTERGDEIMFDITLNKIVYRKKNDK